MSTPKVIPAFDLTGLAPDLASVFDEQLDVRGYVRCPKCGKVLATLIKAGSRAIVVETRETPGHSEYRAQRRQKRSQGADLDAWDPWLRTLTAANGEPEHGSPRWHDLDDDLVLACRTHGQVTATRARIKASHGRTFNAEMVDDLGSHSG